MFFGRLKTPLNAGFSLCGTLRNGSNPRSSRFSF